MKDQDSKYSYLQYTAGTWEGVKGEVVTEAPVSLTVNGEIWLSLVCTPIDVEALAVGFLFSEGLIDSIDEVASARACPSGENVDIWLTHAVKKPENWRRTTGCVGGITSVGESRSISLPSPGELNLSPDRVCALVLQLYDNQDLYQRTGGIHSSALSDGENIIVYAEDVGRHNTLDKISGKVLLERLSLSRQVILTTGRISSEMLQKAARMGAPILISRTSPTTLSIHLAEQWGITLVGYARRDRFRVYTHPERITVEQADLQLVR
jgi:FdhD protein